MNRVTLVTLVYSPQEEAQSRRRRTGVGSKVEGRINYDPPLLPPLIKNTTSNMFLMTLKAREIDLFENVLK